MTVLPSLFIAHGAPDLPLSEHPAKQFLNGLADRLPTPRAIVIISAHWEAATPTLATAAAPQTVYDFGGWPASLYQLTYPAQTSAETLSRVRDLFKNAGIVFKEDPRRGFDHGVWVPLILTYPDADVPVVQISLQRGGIAQQHFDIGRALSPLREESVLIIGSGAVVHNLGALAPEGTPVPGWARDFDQWMDHHLCNRNLGQLLDFPNVPPEARQAHPSLEHLMPIFVAMGAGWQGGRSLRLHHSYSYGSIGMACYAFGGDQEIDATAKKQHRTTPEQILGPYYPVEPDLDADNDLTRWLDAAVSADGLSMRIDGQVVDANNNPVADALIETWQCDSNGLYRHPDAPDHDKVDPNFAGYGRFVTARDGCYWFRALKPVSYPGRAPHLHFKVSAAGYQPLVTQMYVDGEMENDADFALLRAGSQENRARLIVTLGRTNNTEEDFCGTFDIVLEHLRET